MSARWRFAAAVTALLLAAGLTGCGIPGSTDVQVHGEMPSPDAPGGGNPILPVDRQTANVSSPEALLASFLSAAAGDPEQAVDRVRSFLAPTQSAAWKPSNEINIVRLIEPAVITDSESSSTAVVRVQHLGVLAANGAVEPPTNDETEYTFTVGQVAGQDGYWVFTAPPLLLLPDEELEARYTNTPVYFWNKERTALVPDLRWLPLSITSDRRPTELLEWLIGGPSALIGQAVDGLPANVKQKGNVPKAAAGDPLEVNLSAEAGALDDDAIRRLGAQLYWTLRAYAGGGIQVKVEGQARATFAGDAAVLAANPSSQLVPEPGRFAIYDGRIVRMGGGSSPAPAAAVPLVTPETNTGVRYASFSRFGQRTVGAWVRDRGTGAGLELVVAPEVLGKPPLRTPLGDAEAGRPVWLWAPGATADQAPDSLVGLIVVNGRLQQFGTQATSLTPIAVPNLPGPEITDMAVSYDGQRIALVSGGRVFVAALIRTDTNVKISASVREVPTSLQSISAVDFAREDRLILAGQKARQGAIVEVTVDGVFAQDRATALGTAQVTYLAAYPVNPSRPGGGGSEALYVSNNIAYSLLFSSTRIDAVRLGELPSDAVSGTISAPFFQE
ncbi:LpqB family beta-propeller domain-containing protein [Catenuloplanes atrovinosus]|uniref:GerMN domain-containing protein n=1 Tax=Catenuloplanes atrovinosus TaxID=137266 RepID=A0AAE3YSI2_9ACTN|nr:LpqB family beta-propeller domain-containing protein [Catenuloplanes atrovinosus]MDR7279158.1 hypothetical protein [Catenuloplanes atrovinosus]